MWGCWLILFMFGFHDLFYLFCFCFCGVFFAFVVIVFVLFCFSLTYLWLIVKAIRLSWCCAQAQLAVRHIMHCTDERSDMRKLAVPFAHLTGMPVFISAGKTEESGHSHQKTIWVSILEERGCRNGGSLQGCPMAPCCSLSCSQQCYSSSLSCPTAGALASTLLACFTCQHHHWWSTVLRISP